VAGIIIPILSHVILFSGILEIIGTLLFYAYAFNFIAIQRHLFSDIGTTVC
jgi:hypothetical protein